MPLTCQPGQRLDAALDVQRQVVHFQEATAAWHGAEYSLPHPDDTPLLLHRANFELWHLEDEARDPRSTDAVIAHVKRNIDRVNQHRNDLVERFDSALLNAFAARGLPSAAATLHSETPGMMLDRLSILTLKLFHTAEQAARADASRAHCERNRQRLLVLQQQSEDLAACLERLLDGVTQGSVGYRLYRQMKMYNDPELNPVLYGAMSHRGEPGSA